MFDTLRRRVDMALSRADKIARRLNQPPRLRDLIVPVWLDRHTINRCIAVADETMPRRLDRT